MKLGPVTKPDKRNKTTSKEFDVEFMSANCNVIVIFQLWAIWSNPEAGFRTHSLKNLHFH